MYESFSFVKNSLRFPQPDGGLAFAICEIIMTLRGEIKYIWTYEHLPRRSIIVLNHSKRDLRRFTLVKLLYLISRYFALAAHMICRYNILFRLVVMSVMLGALDIILMIRVYALYNRRTSITASLIFLFVSKLVSTVMGAYLGFGTQRFDSNCLVTTGSQPALYLIAGGELVFQLVILAFTLSGHLSATRGGWGNPLVSLLSRDGSISFTATTVAIVGAIAFAVKPANRNHILFPSMVCITSTAGCRLIMNMQHLAKPPAEPDSVLTTMDLDAWAITEINFDSEENSTISEMDSTK
ncbi:hypothetical protein DFH07DRAFT_767908 [Mycena maculata]|uniref:DUF6533 domain-containing protein n=1 Tax=Mycena maculata TaxID=230809 RepID=A0AAD7JXK4_9AGAR|nr:hypothetical protein DFH07DRAFT_767908 [Mycena maculata]